MKTVLLANIGNSDIQVEGQKLAPYREKCLEWLELLEADREARDLLRLPIIQPMLDHIKDITGAFPTRVIFFVTDQPESAPAAHREKDTYPAGLLIQRLLEEDCQVDLRVIKEQPNDYIAMHRWFSRHATTIIRSLEKELDTVDHLFMGLSGGTPACNMNLLLAVLEDVETPFTTLYVNEATSKVSPGNYAGLMRRAQVLRLFHSLIDRDDYPAALALAREAWPTQKGLTALLTCLMNLQLFRFKEASSALSGIGVKGYHDQLREVRNLVERASEGVKNLEQGERSRIPSVSTRVVLNEMWYQACRKYMQGEYVDFVLRFCGLRETLLCHRAQLHLGKRITSNEKQEEAYNTCTRAEPTSPLTLWAIDSDRVRVLRNSLWVTHGLEGVSEQEVKTRWKGSKGILQDTADMLAEEFHVSDLGPSAVARALLDELMEQLTETPAPATQQTA